ncbi:NAD-dependent epimerase/dehydratase family protein [Haematobacter missouriensis]|nr:NAD(P)-dependent oxidoreductase [Haematobacter missouriensis]
MTTPRYDTILITGAAGMLGTELRKGLAPFARKLRLNDRVEIADLQPNEEAAICDLGDMAAVSEMVKGVDAIVHFGGASRERPWEDVLNSTISGSYNIYESARQHGVKRIVFASSVHAIGFHELESHIDATTPTRPDTLYGLSKCFVEDLSRL